MGTVRKSIRILFIVLAIAIAGALFYRGMIGKPVSASYPIQSAHVRESDSVRKLDIQRTGGSSVEDLMDLRCFDRFRPVHGLNEAISRYGRPDRKRFAEHRTTLEYDLEAGGRVDIVKELVAGGASYSVVAFPANLDVADVLCDAALELVFEHLDPMADKSLICVSDPNGELEILITLRGFKIEKISW